MHSVSFEVDDGCFFCWKGREKQAVSEYSISGGGGGMEFHENSYKLIKFSSIFISRKFFILFSFLNLAKIQERHASVFFE